MKWFSFRHRRSKVWPCVSNLLVFLVTDPDLQVRAGSELLCAAAGERLRCSHAAKSKSDLQINLVWLSKHLSGLRPRCDTVSLVKNTVHCRRAWRYRGENIPEHFLSIVLSCLHSSVKGPGRGLSDRLLRQSGATVLFLPGIDRLQ